MLACSSMQRRAGGCPGLSNLFPREELTISPHPRNPHQQEAGGPWGTRAVPSWQPGRQASFLPRSTELKAGDRPAQAPARAPALRWRHGGLSFSSKRRVP